MLRTLRAILCALICIGWVLPAGASALEDEPFKKPAWVSPVDRDHLRILSALGADIDGIWGDVVRIYGTDETLAALRELGFAASPISDGRKARTAAGYPTPADIGKTLSELAARHPGICRLHSIGQSPQGRDLWMVRITDSPEIEEDEPEVLFVGGIHGDEPPGTILCLRFISMLLENYGADAALTEWVDETEIWVLPLMNPDGYAAGSRYTARGEDLNRSFPDRIRDAVNTPTGRPIETRHLMNWAFDHSPVLSISFHTGALVVNYPFDAVPDPYAAYAESPDDALFIEQSRTYASRNPPMSQSPWFPGGITNGLAWYAIYGGMQDWFYVWQGCNQLTVEASDIKTPPSTALDELWEDNRDAMLAYLTWSRRGVRGLITNRQTGEPVAATIRVAGIDHDVFTDPDVGDYHRMLLPGVYGLVVRAEGCYEEMVSDIVVGEGQAARVDVSLEPLKKGDVDGDRKVGLADAVRSLQVAAGISVETLRRGADVDGDGRIGLAEALFVLNAIQ